MTDRPIISVHFPKAAGSSLKKQLQSHFGDLLVLDYDHDPFVPRGRELTAFPNGKRIVHGHFRAQRYSAPNAYMMTFLREPVDNLISIYFFWRSHPSTHELHSRFLSEKPSILEFAEYPDFKHLMSDRYFGGFDMRRFDFIGFYDSLARDFVLLSEELGLALDHELHENRTPGWEERGNLMGDQKTMSAIRDTLREDVRFYESLR